MHAVEGEERGRQAGKACLFVFTNEERDLQLERVQLEIRKAPPGGRGAWRRVRRWRRKRGQPGVSALTSATPRFFCHRSVPLHLHAAPRCTPRRPPVIGLPPTRALSPRLWNQSPRRKRPARFYLARSKPTRILADTCRQPVFMTVLKPTDNRILDIGRRLIITEI